MAQVSDIRQGSHYAVGEIGDMSALDAKLFVAKALALTGMEVSFNRAAPGQESPFLHQHRQHEELYIFLSGQGQFQVDGQVIDVHPGTLVRVNPEGARAWRNTGTQDMTFIVIQANVGSLTAQDGMRSDRKAEWS